MYPARFQLHLSNSFDTKSRNVRHRCFSLFCCLTVLSLAVHAEQEGEDIDAIVGEPGSSWSLQGLVNKFERQFSTRNDDQHAEWAGFFRLARDGNAIWLSTKGSTKRGDIDSAEIRLFYSRRVAAHVDLHLGWRRDIEPEPNRDWLGFGVLAVLPFKVGADASLFVGDSGRLAARLEFAYKYRITDKLSLTPDLEANFYSETDTATSTGSGLADLDLGLRLRYRIVEGVAPYAGITWKGNFATTEDIVEGRGEDSGDLRWLLGFMLWF